jgi:hypothetical protein
MIICGIDPGLTGAVAFIDHHGLRAVFDLPTMPRPNIGPAASVKRVCDGRGLSVILRDQHDPREPMLVVLEDVRMLGGKNNSMQSQEALVHTRGVVEGVLAARGHDLAIVSPRTWKAFFGLQADKNAALALARSFFGLEHLARVKDHNRAEAMLIARYAQRTMT